MLPPDYTRCPGFACPVRHLCARALAPIDKYHEMFESTPYDHGRKECHAFAAGNEIGIIDAATQDKEA
jgi:hypothetical protein